MITVQTYNKNKINELLTKNHNVYNYIKQIDDFLFEVQYSHKNIDNSYANNYFKQPLSTTPVTPGACTGVYHNGKVLRHLDWNYNNEAEFIIRTVKEQEQGKLASIGIAGCSPTLTREFVESGDIGEKYKLLPFATVDGINEAGVYIQSNVTPKKATAINTTHTCAESEYKGELATNMICRIVLDNCGTVNEILTELSKYDIYRSPKLPEAYDPHWLVADATGNHKILEMKQDGTGFDLFSYGANDEIMSNFSCDSGITNNTFELDWDEINTSSPYGSGLERWELVAEKINNNTINLDSLRTDLLYTNSYNRSMSPEWLTEFVGQEYAAGQKLTVALAKSNPELFDSVIDVEVAEYNNRSRETGKTWQTVHSAIYDISTRSFVVAIQERLTKKYYFSLNEIDASMSNVSENAVQNKVIKSYVDSQLGQTEFTFSTTATIWTCEHNLDKYPSVICFDSSGNTIIGSITYVNKNTLNIGFDTAQSGKAIIN